MFSLQTLTSLAWQLARLVPKPSGRFGGRGTVSRSPTGERFGLCPHCREFVRIRIRIRRKARGVPCPSCGRAVDALEPLVKP